MNEKPEEAWLSFWTKQPSDYFKSWLKTGIPLGVYFAEERWIVEHYWQEEGDIIANIKLPKEYVRKITPTEFITIYNVPLEDFWIVEAMML